MAEGGKIIASPPALSRLRQPFTEWLPGPHRSTGPKYASRVLFGIIPLYIVTLSSLQTSGLLPTRDTRILYRTDYLVVLYQCPSKLK